MIDYILSQAIVSSINEQSRHEMWEVVLFVTYIVICVAAIVTAAVRRKSDASPIVLATVSPLIYWILTPFGLVH